MRKRRGHGGDMVAGVARVTMEMIRSGGTVLLEVNTHIIAPHLNCATTIYSEGAYIPQ